MPDSGASVMEERFVSHEARRELVEEWVQASPDLVQIVAGMGGVDAPANVVAAMALQRYRALVSLVEAETDEARSPSGEQK